MTSGPDECGRKPRPDENAEDDWRTWRTYYEGVGDGVTLCSGCAQQIATRRKRA
jgi:hypothetical protein